MENTHLNEHGIDDGEKNYSPVWLYINIGSNYPHVKKIKYWSKFNHFMFG